MSTIERHYRQLIGFAAFMLLGLLAGCGGGDPILGTPSVALAPSVTSTTPADIAPGVAATGVATNSKISATFSEAMDPATLVTPATTFTLAGPGATLVPGTVAYTGTTVIFTPTSNLAANTLYTATISSAAKNPVGSALGGNFTWAFTTGAAADAVAPSVSATGAANGATGLPVNRTLTAIFSEVMNPVTISATTFTLKQGITPVSGTVAYSGVTATFTPTSLLAANTLYSATITTAAQDLAGNPLASDYVWSWTTGAAADTTAPTVSSTGAANGATGVAINRNSTATFSEAMNPSTISTATFTLKQGATPVPGTVTYVGTTASFNPTSALAPSTTYTSTITTGARDLVGNPLASNHVWSWTTGAAADTTAPTVSSTLPANVAVGVAVNANITATFSEAMNPLTVTNLTMTVAQGVNPVPGAVTYVGTSATFNPNSDLLASTVYTATITTGVQDLAGNALALTKTWSFTTSAAADTTAPTVVGTSPPDLATGVCSNKAVNASFDEAMDASTITTASFIVTGAAFPVPGGSVSYDVASRIATYTPATPGFPVSTPMTATIKGGVNGVKDLAGNALVADKVWHFTTGATTCQAPVNLGSLSTFAAVAGAGLTNSNSGGMTTINGNVGLSPTATCLGDGVACGATNPTINGTLYAADPGGVAAQAKADLTLAYVDAAGRPPGTVVNDLSGMVLAPGVYTSGSTMSIAVGGTLTLDAQGDANAVWIFQVGSSFTGNNNAQVLLVNGAKAANVYWAVFASSTLGSNVSFKGNILAGASNSLGTSSVLEGRLLCSTGQITLLSNTLTIPAQ